ncbi:MAG: polyprenyl synthetase family protein [Longimicrobiales bacterium]|nr:polyprenyl synthetase family protein [Longimicrobiales bacterium]
MQEISIPSLDEIQRPIASRLDRVMEELRSIVTSDFDRIEEVNDYLALLRGKLFRPALVLLSNEVDGGRDDRAITLAAVVELVHLATLVHDDAVDHSVLRRGQPTVNAMWTHQVAIIMGDYLYSRAITHLARVGLMDAVTVMATAANEMSIGEMRQLTAFDALGFSEEDYTCLIEAKTASLMKAACELGALVGPAEYRSPLARYGHALGMAFQVADDILDYTASEEETGKPTGHDLREHKVTLPLVGALRQADAAEMKLVRAVFDDPEPSDDAIERVVAWVAEAGGLEYAQRRADAYADAAMEALSVVPSGEATEALVGTIAYATRRTR